MPDRDEPWTWSQDWAGMPGLRPDQYVKLGRL